VFFRNPRFHFRKEQFGARFKYRYFNLFSNFLKKGSVGVQLRKSESVFTVRCTVYSATTKPLYLNQKPLLLMTCGL
jgi:hypothetical protein